MLISVNREACTAVLMILYSMPLGCLQNCHLSSRSPSTPPQPPLMPSAKLWPQARPWGCGQGFGSGRGLPRGPLYQARRFRVLVIVLCEAELVDGLWVAVDLGLGFPNEVRELTPCRNRRCNRGPRPVLSYLCKSHALIANLSFDPLRVSPHRSLS